MDKGRKFEALIYAIYMWALLLFCMMNLKALGQDIPGSFGTAFIILSGVIPTYIGANAVQKREEIKANGGVQ